MAVSSKKLRTLIVMKILVQESDENNPVTRQRLQEILEDEYEITAERKSIYSDIETLKEFGLDIKTTGTRDSFSYYLNSRDFELAELKLLVDAVQSSKFITCEKSKQLISKIERLTSPDKAKMLNRDVFIYDRAKTENESIYSAVDEIHSAILQNRSITFQYTEWTLEMKLVPKKNGELYDVSPWLMTWDSENYYLIAYDNKADMIKHFRVDKMKNVSVSEKPREGRESFDDFSPVAYCSKTFDMFSGADQKVNLKCHNSIIGVIIDRFSKNVMVVPLDEEHFQVSVTVAASPKFLSWVFSLGNKIEITWPKSVKESYISYMRNILDMYNEET